MDDSARIRSLVRELNRRWVSGRTNALEEFFHRDVIVVAPGFERRVKGREACIRSYEEFVTTAVIHRFEGGEPHVDLVGSTAVAACPYEIEYEIGNSRWRGSGWDLLVWEKVDGEWKIAWRTLLAGPEEEVTARKAEGS